MATITEGVRVELVQRKRLEENSEGELDGESEGDEEDGGMEFESR